MWNLPGPRLARIYNILTVLLAIPCCFVLMRVMMSDIRSTPDDLGGAGLVIGASWLAIPLLALAGVAAANFPSVRDHTKAFLSSLAFGGVVLLAALPLLLMFVL